MICLWMELELTCNSELGNFVELNAVACDVLEVEEG